MRKFLYQTEGLWTSSRAERTPFIADTDPLNRKIQAAPFLLRFPTYPLGSAARSTNWYKSSIRYFESTLIVALGAKAHHSPNRWKSKTFLSSAMPRWPTQLAQVLVIDFAHQTCCTDWDRPFGYSSSASSRISVILQNLVRILRRWLCCERLLS